MASNLSLNRSCISLWCRILHTGLSQGLCGSSGVSLGGEEIGEVQNDRINAWQALRQSLLHSKNVASSLSKLPWEATKAQVLQENLSSPTEAFLKNPS